MLALVEYDLVLAGEECYFFVEADARLVGPRVAPADVLSTDEANCEVVERALLGEVQRDAAKERISIVKLP